MQSARKIFLGEPARPYAVKIFFVFPPLLLKYLAA